MKKDQIDELYHLLRVASNEPADPMQSFSTQQVVTGLTRHLLGGGDYLALVQYSYYYGTNFLLNPTYKAILRTKWKFDRIVEFGAGLSWLGRGLAATFGVGYVLVDKRPWGGVTLIDLETEAGIQAAIDNLKPNDLIVMSDFLHCIDDPVSLLSTFGDWRMAVLEYTTENPEYMVSYADQVKRYGAEAIAPQDFELEFLGREIIETVDLDPYVLILADRRKKMI